MSFTTTDYKHSDVVVLGIPYDETCSFKKGASKAPFRVREVFESLEDYSPLAKKNFEDLRCFDKGNLDLPQDTYAMLSRVEKSVRTLINDGKKLVLIGGEHTVSLGVVRAFDINDLTVVQFDAHFDMREQYLGNPYSHACVMHHITRLVGEHSVVRVGMRSGTEEEFKHSFYNYEEAKEKLKEISGNVYITIDVDVLDPAFAPGTGTPEPNGLSYSQLEELLCLINADVVGFDVVEISPPNDCNDITSIIGAKLIRDFSLFYF